MKQQTRYWFGKKNDCKVSHTGADTVLTTGDANCRARADFFSNPLGLSSGGAITNLAPLNANKKTPPHFSEDEDHVIYDVRY